MILQGRVTHTPIQTPLTKQPTTPKSTLVKPHLWPGQCLFTKKQPVLENSTITQAFHKNLESRRPCFPKYFFGHPLTPESDIHEGHPFSSVAPSEKLHLSSGCPVPLRKTGTLLLGEQTNRRRGPHTLIFQIYLSRNPWDKEITGKAWTSLYQ